jgi:hypothetical protein
VPWNSLAFPKTGVAKFENGVVGDDGVTPVKTGNAVRYSSLSLSLHCYFANITVLSGGMALRKFARNVLQNLPETGDILSGSN